MGTWFQPSVSLQRFQGKEPDSSSVIRRRDLLHCDIGITYLCAQQISFDGIIKTFNRQIFIPIHICFRKEDHNI